MPKQLKFKHLILKHAVPFTVVIKTEGYYNEKGKWVPGTTTNEQREGAILPLSKDDLKHVENGTYTTKDRKVYTLSPLSVGDEITYEGQTYTIDQNKPYNAYTDVYIYFAKGASA